MLYLFLALLSVGIGLLASICHQIARRQQAQISALEGGKFFWEAADLAKGVK